MAQVRHQALTWLALFLGTFQPFGAWAQQDPCEPLFNFGFGSLVDVFPLFFEYSHCIRQDAHCQDSLLLPCSEHDCDAEFDLTAWVRAASSGEYDSIANTMLSPGSFGYARLMSVSSVCPLTCGVCGPSKIKRQVKPNVAAILRGPCEQGWSYADGACFKYAIGGQDGVRGLMRSWHSAEQNCREKGAHLATVMTKAQEHLVFDLIQDRPAHLGSLGLWAWIGLWTGSNKTCSTNSSHWTWIGSPQHEYMLQSSFRPDCRKKHGKAHAFYSNNVYHGETSTFSSAQVTKKRRAWICSKPALFHTVTGRLCQDAGLFPILEREACEAAGKILMGVDVPAFRMDGSGKPYGCSTFFSKHGLRVNADPADQSVPAPRGRGVLLCQSNTTGQTLTNPDIGLRGQWQGVHAGNASLSFSQPVLAAILAASILPVFMVLVVKRQVLLSLTCRVPVLVLELLESVLRRETGVGDHFIMVAARLRQWRRTMISIAAVVVAGFHLFELIRICFVVESVCTHSSSLSQLRLFLAFVHLGSLWAASLFLPLTHWFRWKSSCPDLAFLFAITVLDIAWTGLAGEQALLVESRVYRQLLWRLLLGACTSPIIALLGNLLYLIGAGTVYKVLIPDGFIFTVGSTRAGLLYQQGCNQLWSKHDAVVGKELLQDLSRFRGVMDMSSMPKLVSLLDELLQKQTSFTNFVLSEVVLCTVVMVALLCINALLSQRISKSLQLQCSEDQLLAVSQILDRLCDATCQLSANLQICSCSRKLGAILHMSSSAWRTMEGMDFCDLLPSADDLARFRAFVDQGIREGFQEALYFDLKGASGMKVRMQLLCAKFRDVLGHPRVLCGFTEISADGPSGGVKDDAELVGPLPLIVPSRSHKARRSRHRGRSRSGRSNSSSSDSETESEQRCAATIHVAEDMRVVSATQGFLDFLGMPLFPFHAGGFLPFLAEPAVFVESVSHSEDGMSSDGLEAPSSREIDITFNRLIADTGDVHRERCKAVCKVELRVSPDEASIYAKLWILKALDTSSHASASVSSSLRPEQSGQQRQEADVARPGAAAEAPNPSIVGKPAL